MTIAASTADLYSQLRQHLQQVADIAFSAAVLQWDQETYLPSGSAEARNRQVATLVELAHEKFTQNELGDLLETLSERNDLPEDARQNVLLAREEYSKKKKLPPAFVRALSEASGKAFHNWIAARKQNDFPLFAASLQEIVQLKKQQCELVGYSGHAFNALLNEYDKGCTVAELDGLFGSLKPRLHSLLQRVMEKPAPDDSFLRRHFPAAEQWTFGLRLLENMGFDFTRGRQDVSAHPFTINFGSTDVRITTRTDENDFGNMTWSCLHEGGHGLYEQGLPENEYGMPLGEAASFAVHESQSRIWENNVGRSRAYWNHWYPELQKIFPAQLGNTEPEAFYRGINRVQPSFIRTEADELTYHFHIIIRYEIELALLQGDLQPADVPAAWNRKYADYLGITPENDSNGCLQDVHWSHGDLGYFPSYSLGTIMAAQLYAAFLREHPGFEGEMAAGHTGNLLNWLRKAIHIFGKRYTRAELCRLATGEEPDARYLMDYLEEKYTGIYNL